MTYARILAPFALVLLLAFLAGCGRSPTQTKRGRMVERLPRLEVVQPTRKRIVRRLETSAVVEALKKVDLSARVPGEVIGLEDRMDIGRKVSKGEVLVQLKAPELVADRDVKQALVEQARKQEAVASTALVVARREVQEGQAEEKRWVADVAFNKLRHARVRQLVQQRAQEVQLEQEAMRQLETAEAGLAVNRMSVSKRQARVEAAQADLDLAQERVRTAQAEVKRLNELLDLTTVRAPFDGVITRRWVDPGAIIRDPGTLLLTLVQMDRVRVLIDVPQRDVTLLNAREQNPNPDGRGDPVQIRMPGLKDPLQGYLTRVARSLDPVTRTMRAEVELDNKDLLLQPGMFGSASVLVEDRSNVLALPAGALMRQGEGVVEVYQVAGVTGEGDERRGVLKRVPVQLGIDDGKEVEIRGGLAGDELIVARATGVMRADETVLAITDRESLRE